MSWTEEKVSKLKELWGKGNTASQIAEIIGGISRNAVIGKAHRLNLSAKIKTRTATSNKNFDSNVEVNNPQLKRGKKSRFKSLIIEKDFEPENPKQLEELDESSCKWPIGHPDEKNFIFVEDHL
jgi:GcrA cell cycle regulator